jgi:hypothetical protein
VRRVSSPTSRALSRRGEPKDGKTPSRRRYYSSWGADAYLDNDDSPSLNQTNTEDSSRTSHRAKDHSGFSRKKGRQPRSVKLYWCSCGKQGKRFCRDDQQPYFVFYNLEINKFVKSEPFEGLEQPTDGHFCPQHRLQVEQNIDNQEIKIADRGYAKVLWVDSFILYYFETAADYACHMKRSPRKHQRWIY